MTITHAALKMPVEPALNKQASQDKAKHDADIKKVSKQFESVLVSQLLSVMWKTTSQSMGGDKAGQYQQMFQSAFADHIVSGGGIGLSRMIEGGLRGRGEDAANVQLPAVSALSAGELGALAHPNVGRKLSIDATRPTEPGVGVMASVQRVAPEMRDGGGSDRWARNGTLTEADLPSDFTTAAPGGEARFNVRDANGYQGYYKCNLFALEVARRSGLQVPVVAREAGWGFPSSNRITQDASDGSLQAGWAKVATGASPAAMQEALRAGEVAFLLVGSGAGDRHGHMAVVERPRAIEYDDAGQVQRIVFDGWEAQPGGARHLQERAWNRAGHAGGSGDRNGLTDIEIIQLNRPSPETTAEQPLTGTANSSRLDSVSSNERIRPTQGGKEHS